MKIQITIILVIKKFNNSYKQYKIVAFQLIHK